MTSPEQRPRVEGERVAEWAALADAATPGPWFSDDATASPGDVSLWHGGNAPWLGELVVNLGGSFVEVGVACENEVANARFIAAAREAVPALTTEVTRLTAEVARLRDLVGEAYQEASASEGRCPWELSESFAALALPTNAPEATDG